MDTNASKTNAGDGATTTPATPAPTGTSPAGSGAATSGSGTTGTSPTSSPAGGATERQVASDASRAAGGPSAGTEPATQVASATARPTPATPSTYEMPDDYADESWVDRTKAWVEANPALAVLAAAGVGLVVGRLVIGLTPDPEPPSLHERIEKRAREMGKETRKGGRRAAKRARNWAGDAEDTLRDAAGTAGTYASIGAERTRDLADTLSDVVKEAAARLVDEWASRVKR